jgi:hypothetical protein
MAHASLQSSAAVSARNFGIVLWDLQCLESLTDATTEQDDCVDVMMEIWG